MVVIIAGPTAVGKSAAALEIGRRVPAEIISADSMQVYQEMNIGTAKPSLRERGIVHHHLIDICRPDQEWTVSDFIKKAKALIPAIKERKRIPFIVGGTGLYLWTLLEGFSFPLLPADKALREELQTKDSKELYQELKRLDPEAAQKIHFNDQKRIIRALEVIKISGEKISTKQQEREKILKKAEVQLFILNLPREEVYERIEKRVDKMFSLGLVAEVKGLLAKDYQKDLPALQALGYKEVLEYLEGRETLNDTITKIKTKTRQFAKRQLTWFRRFKEAVWISPADFKKRRFSLDH